jgi:hypothetical protein
MQRNHRHSFRCPPGVSRARTENWLVTLGQKTLSSVQTIYCVCPNCRGQTIIQVGESERANASELDRLLRCVNCDAREANFRTRAAASQVSWNQLVSFLYFAVKSLTRRFAKPAI